MGDRYIVRCTSAIGRAMAGIYAASLTPTGMVATWKRERAARHDSALGASRTACELGRKFTGTIWRVEPVEVAQ